MNIQRRERRGFRRVHGAKGIYFLCALCVLLCGLCVESRGDSTTFRNNAARTGVFDDKAGPGKPKVLWVYKQQEQFVAAAVPDHKGGTDGALYVTGIGPFSTAMFHALSLDPKAKDRELWQKSSPYISMPTVSSPVVVGDMVIFGDGMHQTDGATLYCYTATKGVPLWKYEVPGKLVHMECPPTYFKGRVYIGAGDGGVICVDSTTVTMDGKELKLADVRAGLEAKYEAAVKASRDGDVDEAKLTKVTPKLIWQKGKGQWHVDAALGITDDGKKLLVASSYIDNDKVGKRAIMCLNAETGETLWDVKLDFNPWGGATISGESVLVTCSSIRYDVTQLEGAKGAILCLNLANGEAKWNRAIEGGAILSPAVVKRDVALTPVGDAPAFKGDVVLYAGTDGKIVCRELETGTRKWTFDGDPKKPFFTAPCVTADMVYAVDINGVLYAMALDGGKAIWNLDVPNDKMVQAPGIVFGSPALAGGHIYMVTNTLHSDGGNKPGAVICIGDESELRARRDVKVEVDQAAKTVTIPCEVAPRKLPTLKDIYPLEVVATYPTPQGQKAHETVVVFDPSVKVSEIQKKLESLGAKAGKPATADTPPTGSVLKLSLVVPGPTGTPRIVPIEKVIVDARTNKPLPTLTWRMTGSVMKQLSPEDPKKVYAADMSGTLIAIYPVTDETLVQSNLTNEQSGFLRLEVNKNLLPEEGSPVSLRIEVVQ